MKFLVIQTSFLGDVILATAIAEKLHSIYPHGAIDFLVKFGNESVLKNNPNIRNVLVWDKKHDKYGNLIKLIGIVRKHQYEYVINLHRFGSSGLLCLYGLLNAWLVTMLIGKATNLSTFPNSNCSLEKKFVPFV